RLSQHDGIPLSSQEATRVEGGATVGGVGEPFMRAEKLPRTPPEDKQEAYPQSEAMGLPQDPEPPHGLGLPQEQELPQDPELPSEPELERQEKGTRGKEGNHDSGAVGPHGPGAGRLSRLTSPQLEKCGRAKGGRVGALGAGGALTPRPAPGLATTSTIFPTANTNPDTNATSGEKQGMVSGKSEMLPHTSAPLPRLVKGLDQDFLLQNAGDECDPSSASAASGMEGTEGVDVPAAMHLPLHVPRRAMLLKRSRQQQEQHQQHWQQEE
ncbi:unnamed protein product, partial [Discosporangium mesarthrocarpum]